MHRRMPSPRRGNMIILVSVLSLVMFTAISTLFFLVSEEREQTGTLVKEIRATYVGEGVCNHVVSLVNRRPWEERFYLDRARLDFSEAGTPPTPVWTFTDGDFPFDGSASERFGDDVEYVGTVKDLDPFLRTYRVYVEVSYLDHKVTFSWDKRYEEDFLGSLNGESTDLNKAHDALHLDTSSSDARLDRIRREAEDPSKVVPPEDAAELTRLKTDTVEFRSKIGLSPDLLPDTSKPDPRGNLIP